MPFQTGSSTSIKDLFLKLETFASGMGYTTDYSASNNNGHSFIHYTLNNTKIYIGFVWDTGTPANVGIYQSRGYVSGTPPDPAAQTDGSGQGYTGGTYTNANLGTGRSVALNNSGMPYWFFGTTATKSIHVAVVTDAGTSNSVVMHFGFGEISSLNTGLDYAYGSILNASGPASTAVDTRNSFLLDALTASGGSPDGLAYAASICVFDVPNPPSSGSNWAVVGNMSSLGTDNGGKARGLVRGGFRGGFAARAFGRWGANNQLGFVPAYPILVASVKSGGTDTYLLGQMSDVAGLSVQYYEIGNTISIGSDTWYSFPTQKKSGNNVASTTYWSGIAYRRNDV